MNINLKKLCSIILLLFIIGALGQYIGYKVLYNKDLSHYTQEQVTTVFNKVVKHNKHLMNKNTNKKIIVRVIDNRAFNAYVSETITKDNKTVIIVVVFTGLLEFIGTEDQLAAVLGHEWGHYLNGDTRFNWTPKESERVADMLGAYMTHQAGYDACYAQKTWKDLRAKYENDGVSDSHPSYPQRIETLSCEFKLSSKIFNEWVDFNKKMDYAIIKAIDNYKTFIQKLI